MDRGTPAIGAPAVTRVKSERLKDRAPDSVKGSDDRFLSCRTKQTQLFTDSQREEAIKRAGLAVVRHMNEWERTGCFAARGDADRARRLMELLIAGRSPQYVAQLERERGLA